MSALSHNAKLRDEAETWEDPEWLAMTAAHSRKHDYWIRWECAHMPFHLHFLLIPLASDPTVFRLQLLSSLQTFPFRAAQREREAAFRQFLR
eukprot:2309168-Rhodomonas_salina.1